MQYKHQNQLDASTAYACLKFISMPSELGTPDFSNIEDLPHVRTFQRNMRT